MVAFLVLLLVVVHGGLSMGSLNDEGYALLSFKQSISQDPEASLSNWNSSDQNPCSWNGVTCKDLRVVSLSVPRKKLLGFIPSSLGSISGLRHLNLRNNRLYGHLPSELFSPQGLQSLVLYGNSLSGSVPKQVGKLNYLQILDLSSNFLNGSLPESILECRRLRALDLSQNNLTGALPAGFGKALSLLERLDLSFNMFSGSIPGDIGNLSNLLGTLDLSHNRFSGPIPASLGNLPEKVYIDLTHNNLSGPIPQNGALMNRGPTAFLGNPGLCGPPLKSRCAGDEVETPAPSSSSFPYFPENSAPGESQKKPGKGLSKSAVVAIVVSDAVGICLAGLLFSYCYSRVCDCREARRRRTRDGDDEKGVSAKKRRECLCFRKDHESSEIMSEKNNNNNNNAAAESNYDLVALDCQVGFDLDELLKASAFVLGKSGIGIVYKVVLEDGLTLAVRRLGEGGSQRFKEFQTEVEAIGKLRHPNIAALKAYYWSADEKLLIYDYVPNGNLSTALHGKPSGAVPFSPLSWALRLKIMRGIARGLLYLHEFSPKKYVHGDLKPTNVLLDHSFEPRISDFGLARLATIAGGGAAATLSSPTLQSGRSEKTPETTLALSPGPSLSSCYVAPEALKMVKPSQKWDVYSYGVVLLEMVTGRSPVVQVGPAEAVDLVHWIQLCVEEKKPLSEVLDPVLVRDDNADVDDEIVAVIKIAMACIQTSPEKRPTMRHLTEALERI